jgi:hypothetical protein
MVHPCVCRCDTAKSTVTSIGEDDIEIAADAPGLGGDFDAAGS